MEKLLYVKQETINTVRNWIGGTENKLPEDITDIEVITYIEDMGVAHGSIKNYFEYMYAVDFS